MIIRISPKILQRNVNLALIKHQPARSLVKFFAHINEGSYKRGLLTAAARFMLCSTSSGAVCTLSNVAMGTQRCRVADTGTAPLRDQSSLRWKPNGGLEVRDAREGVYSRVQTGVIGRLPLWMTGKHVDPTRRTIL